MTTVFCESNISGFGLKNEAKHKKSLFNKSIPAQNKGTNQYRPKFLVIMCHIRGSTFVYNCIVISKSLNLRKG